MKILVNRVIFVYEVFRKGLDIHSVVSPSTDPVPCSLIPRMIKLKLSKMDTFSLPLANVLLFSRVVLQVVIRLARVSSDPTRQSPLRETVSTSVTGNDLIFANELGAKVEADHHEQKI